MCSQCLKHYKNIEACEYPVKVNRSWKPRTLKPVIRDDASVHVTQCKVHKNDTNAVLDENLTSEKTSSLCTVEGRISQNASSHAASPQSSDCGCPCHQPGWLTFRVRV